MENINYGVQPLDELIQSLGLTNEDLVNNSVRQLTFKQLQKGRKGRRISANIKSKIAQSLNACVKERVFSEKELFNY